MKSIGASELCNRTRIRLKGTCSCVWGPSEAISLHSDSDVPYLHRFA